MRALRTALARVRALWRRDVIADEINEELQFHLEMRVDEHERRGLPRDAAVRAAARRFGNVAVLKDKGYDIRGGGVIETVVADVGHGLGRMRRRWGYATAAILTLALGIGLSTALISIVDATWLRPLPFPDPERLVKVLLTVAESGADRRSSPSIVDVRALRADGRILEGIGQFHQWEERLVLDTGEPERVKVLQMSEGYADLFGLPPALGRTFRLEDSRPGAAPVIVLGHAFWRRRFAGDPDVIGKTFLLGNISTTVVGVLPPALHRDTHVWMPRTLEPHGPGRDSGADVYARLRAGISLPEAERALGALARQWPSVPDWPRITGVSLEPLYDDAVASTEAAVSMIAVSVLVLVALVCVNVAGLLFADGADRRREFAVRASLGAGRGRLIRQMLTEAGVLGTAACFLGVLLAWWSLDSLVRVLPLHLPPHASPALNVRVMVYAVTAALATVLAVSVWPAVRLTRASLTDNIAGAAQLRTGAWPRTFGRGIIAAEVALAVVLLIGGGLLLRSFNRLLSVDLGFQPDAILTMEAVPLEQSPIVWQQYYPQLLARLRTIPGVAAVGAIDGMPLANSRMVVMAGMVDESGNGPPPGPLDSAIMSTVSPGYLEALGVRLLEGRTFTEQDAGRNVIVLADNLARRAFPGKSPVGESISISGQPPLTVIGVVADVRHSPWNDPTATFYAWMIPHAMLPPAIVIRAKPGVTLSLEELRASALSVGIRAFVERIRPGAELLDENVRDPRNLTLLLSLFGGLGLVLTLIGTGGVTAYAVARRTQEVGIRMAFGATPRDVVAGLTSEALRPILAGLVVGLVASYYATAVLERFLFDTPATDPGTFAAVAAGLGVAALIAAWLPARRAASVDPVQALRAE
jgi:putative ABC transport system permease protein